MSRWVNGSLEDLLMVSITPMVTRHASSALRAERELLEWDWDRGDTREPDGPPPRSDHGRADIGAFQDELADDALDLSLRLLVVDSIAAMLPAEGENLSFFTHAAGAAGLREALDDVCARVKDRRLARLIAPDAPLGAYVKGLYLRAAAIARALETHGFAALEERADEMAFARAIDAAAGFHFGDLKDSIRRDLASARLELGQPLVRALRDAVERLFAVCAGLDAIRAS